MVIKNDTQLNSFLSYQLVEADLLKCMPALGDRIIVRFHEIEKTLYHIPTTSRKSKNLIKSIN